MASQVVFVAGLTHSGSTALDLLLGSHPRLVGLGEVVPLLRPESEKLEEPDRICSCGEPLASCRFWAPAREEMRKLRSATVAQRYRRLMDVFAEVFGGELIPVDSSKSLNALQLVAALPEVQVSVLHLIRDVRSWTVSRLDTDVRRGLYALADLYAKQGRQAWRPFVTRNSFARFLLWYRGNREIQQFVAREGLPVFQFGYEEFALRPGMLANEIFRFLDVEPIPSVTDLSQSKSHIALGNWMRLRPEKKASISYDGRWFYRTEWLLPSLLFPRIMRYNRVNVYCNTAQPDPAGALRAQSDSSPGKAVRSPDRVRAGAPDALP